MHGYKEPGYQDRVATAKNAKNKALEQLNNRPPVDPAERARRVADRAAKDEAQQVKRAAARAAKDADKLAKRESDRLAVAEAIAAQPKIVTEADRKMARDERYAARKSRQS